MIRLAFSGASGTGKTTLAMAVADRLGLPLCPVGARSVAAAMGFASPYEADAAGQRVEFQRRLLDEKVAWEAEHEGFVTDRSVADNLAYSAIHEIEFVDEPFLRKMRVGLHRYTYLVYLPVDAYQRLDDDATRVRSASYHEVYDAVLLGLLTRYAGYPRGSYDCRILALDTYGEPVESRLGRVLRFVEPRW